MHTGKQHRKRRLPNLSSQSRYQGTLSPDKPAPVATVDPNKPASELSPNEVVGELDDRMAWLQSFVQGKGWGGAEDPAAGYDFQGKISKQDRDAVARDAKMTKADSDRWHKLEVAKGDKEKIANGHRLWNQMLDNRLGAAAAADSPLRAELLSAASIRQGVDNARKELMAKAKAMGEAAGLEDWQMAVVMKQASDGHAKPDILVQLTEIALIPIQKEVDKEKQRLAAAGHHAGEKHAADKDKKDKQKDKDKDKHHDDDDHDDHDDHDDDDDDDEPDNDYMPAN
jgi:hypothetical protein